VDDTTISAHSARTIRLPWRLALLMGAVIVGIAIGTATTSVVWANHQFDDVPSSNQFHGDITWANNHNIVEGFAVGSTPRHPSRGKRSPPSSADTTRSSKSSTTRARSATTARAATP
jgi:hypothetical protein